MNVTGRIIGLIVGAFFGPLTALLGLFIGLLYDKGVFDEFLAKKGYHHRPYQQYYYQHSHHNQHSNQDYAQNTPNHLNHALNILDITSSATKEKAKKAYRRKMSQHHPDKLIAKGAAHHAIKMANQKTAQIKEAYDTIKQAKGW